MWSAVQKNLGVKGVFGIVVLLVFGIATGYAERGLDYLASRFFEEPLCNSVPLEREADALRKQALSSSDDAEITQLLSASLKLYEQSFRKCKSGEAALQIGIAHCTGLGVPQDRGRGMQFVHQAEATGVNRERIRRAANDYCK